MNKLDRLDRLRRLVEAAGGKVDGRKKLHKLVYLCQRSGTDLGQAFQFHMYGVYSPSLAQDVDAATTWGLLEEDLSAGAPYEIRLPSNSQDAGPGSTAAGDEAGFRRVRTVAGESSGTLEVLSTIVYLWGIGVRGHDLAESLRDLKGHLQSSFDTAFDLANRHFEIRVQ